MKANKLLETPKLLLIGLQWEAMQKTGRLTWWVATFIKKEILPFKEEIKVNIFSIWGAAISHKIQSIYKKLLVEEAIAIRDGVSRYLFQ